MSTVKRAGQYKENPPTGNRWGVPMIGAELAGLVVSGHPGVAVGQVAGTGLATILTGTKAGKNFIRAASNISPTSPSMQKLLNELNSKLPRLMTAYGVQENGEKAND